MLVAAQDWNFLSPNDAPKFYKFLWQNSISPAKRTQQMVALSLLHRHAEALPSQTTQTSTSKPLIGPTFGTHDDTASYLRQLNNAELP